LSGDCQPRAGFQVACRAAYPGVLRGACRVLQLHRREDQGNCLADPESAACRAALTGSTVAYRVGSMAAYPVLSRDASKAECLAERQVANLDETKAAS